MPRIKMDLNDIKLLQDLNPHKAVGPVSIPIHVLKVAAEEIVPILSKMF